MANNVSRSEFEALKDRVDETEDRVIVVETNQKNDSSRLRRIEGGVWFVVGSVLLTLLAALLAK